ncbi:hypothetical protein I6G56_21010 [Burkholderia humptydooensis]|uniref:Uncharacterized protein n=2 Tax=Burkholderia humptydooensis TaxID=430531 RepID=A0A7U4P9J6_9BURK|nr:MULTISPECIES: hypothetical protein [Burkholderia]AJY38585.1 hypothetical protein BW21_5883 [Burkholderia sp. 2002721687]ALX45489.1 hypothetical protein AQ610_23785 [Burkholderia humptydooensis]EIP85308.1 hypothetical protein A33K_17862 [Burkholderia humptydooensis MSMB43]QPS46961.1 hypothetical protein I6G56_21010 [Burkholderia humptydooensis]
MNDDVRSVRIGRLVIDAGALGGLTRERLAAHVQAALAQRLSGRDRAAAAPAPAVARRIVDAVVAQLGELAWTTAAPAQRGDRFPASSAGAARIGGDPPSSAQAGDGLPRPPSPPSPPIATARDDVGAGSASTGAPRNDGGERR